MTIDLKAISDVFENHEVAFLPETTYDAVWFSESDSYGYVVSRAALGAYQDALALDAKTAPPPALRLAVVARLITLGNDLVSDTNWSPDSTKRIGMGRGYFQAPHDRKLAATFKQGYDALRDIAACRLPLSMDVSRSEGVFDYLYEEPAIALDHNFFAVRGCSQCVISNGR